MLQACEVRWWVERGALTKGCVGHLRGSTPGPLVVRGLVATERLLAPYLMTRVGMGMGNWWLATDGQRVAPPREVVKDRVGRSGRRRRSAVLL